MASSTSPHSIVDSSKQASLTLVRRYNYWHVVYAKLWRWVSGPSKSYYFSFFISSTYTSIVAQWLDKPCQLPIAHQYRHWYPRSPTSRSRYQQLNILILFLFFFYKSSKETVPKLKKNVLCQRNILQMYYCQKWEIDKLKNRHKRPKCSIL